MATVGTPESCPYFWRPRAGPALARLPMEWSTLGWDGGQYAVWLASLPAKLQKELQGKLPSQASTDRHAGVQPADAPLNASPWDMSSGPVKELLSELGLLQLYGQTFAEYGFTKISQLTCDGPPGMHAMLRELGAPCHPPTAHGTDPLCNRRKSARRAQRRFADKVRSGCTGVTRDHRDKLVLLAFSARPCGTSGGVFSHDFLAACRPAHAAAMGAENLGPLLYALVRFVKPCHVVEVRAWHFRGGRMLNKDHALLASRECGLSMAF